jgi:NitT/TauT family transport system substrate-binding protein
MMRWMMAAAVLALALPAAAQQPKPDTVSVSQTVTLAQSPYYIAQEKGYFAGEHIAVQSESQRGANDVVGMLATGRLDVSMGAVSAGLFNAVAQGVNLRAVAALGLQPTATRVTTPSVARKDLWDTGAIKSGADFRGRKVAINVPGSIPEFLLTLILDKYGMTVKDVDEVAIGFPEMLIALSNKSLDVAMLPEPYTTTAEQQGLGVVIVPEEHVGAGELTSMVFMSEAFMHDRHDVAVRFLRALLRAAKETGEGYTKDPAMDALLAKATGLKLEAIRDSVAYAFDPTLDIGKYAPSLERQEAAFRKNGRLSYPATLSMDKLVDASLIREAAK